MEPGPRLLLVEDDANVAGTLRERLQQEGYGVVHAGSVAAARAALATEATGGRSFALALLDVGLPDGSGFDIARSLRQTHPETALVFLTAYGTPADRIHGLELGADDYLTKPFVLRELLLRLQAVLRRAQYLRGSGAVRMGRATVDFARFTADVDGTRHGLTHKECAVLKLLHERAGVAVSRDDILERAWSAEEFPTSRTVDNFIVRLRRLVEDDPANPRVIRSIRGVGYLFEAMP
ncbi:MAG: hypothetical protein RL026_830 [Pseudomonadota bacterium]